jgi:potassium channel
LMLMSSSAINRSLKDGTTLLHKDVCDGNIQMVKILLEHGANINKLDTKNHPWTTMP